MSRAQHILSSVLKQQKKKNQISFWIKTITNAATSENTRYHQTDTYLSQDHVRTLCKLGYLKEALNIISKMEYSLSYDMYDALLQGCLNQKNLLKGMLIHAHMIQTAFNFHTLISICNKVITIYAKHAQLAEARRVLDEMPRTNVVSWTTVIAAHSRDGLSVEALELYESMQRKGVEPNQFTFPSVLPACGDLGALERGRSIHEDVVRGGFEGDVFVGNALVDMYGKCGSMKDARQVFDNMPQRNVVSWNSMITAYSREGLAEDVLDLYELMQRRGILPNQFTFPSVLPACRDLGDVDRGKKIHEDALRGGFEGDVFVGNALVDMYGKCGSMEYARQVFGKMPKRNVVSWNSMIAGTLQMTKR